MLYLNPQNISRNINDPLKQDESFNLDIKYDENLIPDIKYDNSLNSLKCGKSTISGKHGINSNNLLD